MPVVTMTGTMASGAREVGRRVASLLGIDFVDQQLMVQAANRCGVPVGVVAERDERTATFRERLSAAFGTLLERSAASAAADPLTGVTGRAAVLPQTYADMAREPEEKPFSDEIYLETMSAIIRELAASDRILLLGRGSQMILKDELRVLHVLCIAPRQLRASRLADREQVGLEEAKQRVEKSDKARAAFYQKLWKVDVEDPRLYDLTLDTARMNFDDCAEVVALAARLKAGEPT
jgi:cytidylate kinase